VPERGNEMREIGSSLAVQEPDNGHRIAPPIISGSLDLRAEPDLFVAAARLVRPRHRLFEGGPRREVVVPRVDVRLALP